MLNLIVPMAGLGSRFAKNGEKHPKPLIAYLGKPFFWWATESVKSYNTLKSLTFVVLRQHIVEFQIDKTLLAEYPEANIVVLEQVTTGAAETALKGLLAIDEISGPIGFLDCDHAFDIGNIEIELNSLKSDAGCLCYFPSNNPAFSYIIIDEENNITGTVEKTVASNRAIAGFYLFRNSETFQTAYDKYIENCPYNELYMSGVFNELLKENQKIIAIELKKHISFGTPEELESARKIDTKALPDWFLERFGASK